MAQHYEWAIIRTGGLALSLNTPISVSHHDKK